MSISVFLCKKTLNSKVWKLQKLKVLDLKTIVSDFRTIVFDVESRVLGQRFSRVFLISAPSLKFCSTPGHKMSISVFFSKQTLNSKVWELQKLKVLDPKTIVSDSS